MCGLTPTRVPALGDRVLEKDCHPSCWPCKLSLAVSNNVTENNRKTTLKIMSMNNRNLLCLYEIIFVLNIYIYLLISNINMKLYIFREAQLNGWADRRTDRQAL